jgi:hypothetical protein
MNVANRVLWRMVIILKANIVNLFVYSVLFDFWYHSSNVLDTPRICIHGYGPGHNRTKLLLMMMMILRLPRFAY